MTPTHRSNRRRTGIAGLALALAATAAACGGDSGASITLSAASSSGGPVDVTYVVDGERTADTVSTPWELTVDVDSRFEIDLTVLNPRNSGTVACGIGGDIRDLEADGPGGAECIVSGTAGNGSISSSGTSRSIDRDTDAIDDSAEESSEAAPGETTLTDEQRVAEQAGPTATIELLVDGEPTLSPTQYDEVDLRVRVDGLDELDDGAVDDDIIVSTLSEFDDGDTVRRHDLFQRYDSSDVESGSLIHPVTERAGYSIVRPGTYRVTVTGSVTTGDDVHPIDEVITFDVDEVPVETTVETFVDGSFTLDLPSNWEIIEDQPFDFVVEDDFGGTSDFIETATPVVGLRSLDADAEFSIFRSTRPLTIPDLGAAEASYRRELGDLDADPAVETQINGAPALRLDAEGGGRALVAEFVRLDSEVLMIQRRGVVGSEALEAVQAIRDSLVVSPPDFPQLMHSVEIDLVADGSTEPYGSFEVPADWQPATATRATEGGVAFASPDGALVVELSSTAEELDIDTVVRRLSELTGVASTNVTVLGDPDVDRLGVVANQLADGSGTILTAITNRSGRTITLTLVDRSGVDHGLLFVSMLNELVVA